jgi:hypothetical protein
MRALYHAAIALWHEVRLQAACTNRAMVQAMHEAAAC